MYEKKYFISEGNILAHELNGLKVKVTKSSDEEKKGIEGEVIKETKNTLVVETSGGKEKVLPKKEVELEFLAGGKKIKVNGNSIVGRPEDRVKEFFKVKK